MELPRAIPRAIGLLLGIIIGGIIGYRLIEGWSFTDAAWTPLFLIAGAVVVESVFSWPGVGRLLVVAVANRDLAVVQCILLLVAITMVTSNLIVDLLYGVLDPRLRSGARAEGH